MSQTRFDATKAFGFEGIESLDEKAEVPLKVLMSTFVEYLYQYLRQTEIHERSNQIFEKCSENLMRTIEIFERTTEDDVMEVSFRGEQLYVNKKRIRVQGRQVRANRFLVRYLRKRLVGKFRFPRSVSANQLTGFLWALADCLERNRESPISALQSILKERALENFELEKAKGFKGAFDAEGDELDDTELLSLTLYEKLKDFVKICLDNLEAAEQFPHLDVNEILQGLVHLPSDDLLQVFRLRLMKFQTDPLPALSVDSSFAVMAWAKSMGLPPGVAADLGKAALTHPFLYLIRKKIDPSPIQEDEVAENFEMADRLKGAWSLSTVHKLVALEWSKPYEEAGVYEIQGTKCLAHFFSRMVAIVARYRAYTLNRSEGEFLLPDEAMAELLKVNKTFDPSLLKLFVNWMGVYPVGSLVQLNSGEIAQVFSGGADPLRFQRPIVSLLKDSTGRVLSRPQLFDLNEMNEKLGVFRKSIKRSVKLEEVNIPEEIFHLSPIGL